MYKTGKKIEDLSPFFHKNILPGTPLEDPHEQSGGLHSDFIVEPLKLELDIKNVGFGLFSCFALEGELSREQDIQKNT